MFARRRHESGGAQVGIVELRSLSLPRRIPRECDESLRREAPECDLPRFMRLRASFMSQWKKNRREWSGGPDWDVQACRYIEARLTLEDDLLDPICTAI